MMDDKKAAYNELKSLVEQHPLDMQYKTMLGNWLMQHDRQKEAFKYFTDVLKESRIIPTPRCRSMIITMPPSRRIWRMACSIRFLMSQKTDTQTKISDVPFLHPEQ